MTLFKKGFPPSFQEKPACLKIHSVPHESEAYLLFQFIQAFEKHTPNHPKQFVFIAHNDSHIEQLRKGLSFFLPALKILPFPSWDCLPYDRVSPNKEIVSTRLETLCALSESPMQDYIVLASANSMLQKTIRQQDLDLSFLSLEKGQKCLLDDVLSFAQKNGYHRVDTVRESGEIAIRGGLIDIFPTGYNKPIRIDFFGDDIESIKSFDVSSQRSIENLDSIHIKVVNEILLTPHNIDLFRARYRQYFGNQAKQADPLYEAVKAGRKYHGIEHWLPLFYEDMDTIFDHIAPTSIIFYDHQITKMIIERDHLIQDYYQARKEALHKRFSDTVYNPIPPDLLYLSQQQYLERVKTFTGCETTTFLQDEKEGINFQAKKLLDLKLPSLEESNIYVHFQKQYELWTSQKKVVLIATYSQGSKVRLQSLLQEYGFHNFQDISVWNEKDYKPGQLYFAVLPFEDGYILPNMVCLTEKNFFGERLIRKSKKSRKAEEIIAEASQLQSGDYLVHYEHGIGQYQNLVTLNVDQSQHDFLELHYLGGDKLFIPIENIDLLSRFGSEDSPAKLDRLGGTQWAERKARIKKKIQDLAEKLLKTAAQRELQKISPPDVSSHEYEKFCSLFPYPETDDQYRAIEETLQDLNKGTLMDRLICGDVGFGKTEVALRAAFTMAMSGRQVAFLVPTTLLCLQHYQNFRKRFKDFPLNIRQISRFNKPSETKEIKKQIQLGQVDIVIGTHALFAKDLSFQDLGLLVVDEEQHFGVVQKEKLKQLQKDTHILTLSATPIPRTLQMALNGVRELSLITTPPLDRLSVRSFIMPFDPIVIREAIMREYFRGGQCFYVCPRLKEVPHILENLKELVPEIKVGVAHGQMASTQLEDTINAFYQGKYDLLLSTNIVESGLDLPNANTIIIHRADLFGLSQLYQLRGRVGRSKIRAYAYFTIPQQHILTESAQKRLEVMQTLDSLGAGFTLASHDLDIRGAGNLLGDEQSGHIREVGSELYQKMLEETIQSLKDESNQMTPQEPTWSPQISMGLSVLIPENYVEDLNIRLSLYKRIVHLKQKDEIDGFASELIDRFGSIPEEVENLLKTVELKALCKEAFIKKIDFGPKGMVVTFDHNHFKNPLGLIEYISKNAKMMFLRPDQTLVIAQPYHKPIERFAIAKDILIQLSEIHKK